MTDIQKFIECSPPITNMVTPAEVHGILKKFKNCSRIWYRR